MFNKILLLGPRTSLGEVLKDSLIAEGYDVVRAPSIDELERHFDETAPHLVLVNGIGPKGDAWLARATEHHWAVPVVALIEPETSGEQSVRDWQTLSEPFAFQDLLFIVQNALHQRTLSGRRPFELPPGVVDRVETILKALRNDLRARCVVLSSSSGRLIKTVGAVDRSIAISLAALMAGSFSASAKAAQLLGQGDLFDSNLQESEGYGLYAILLRDRLILTVAFSAKVTIGMVRHYAAQAAVDILETLVSETERDDLFKELNLSEDFRDDVLRSLGKLLGD